MRYIHVADLGAGVTVVLDRAAPYVAFFPAVPRSRCSLRCDAARRKAFLRNR